MFFFFVGGLEQQAGRVLKSNAGRCIRCGSLADLVESEKVLKLFFVPVWRWPAKDPAFHCRDCSFLFPQSIPVNGGDDDDDGVRSLPSVPRPALTCPSCDRVVERQFRFCPFCGVALWLGLGFWIERLRVWGLEGLGLVMLALLFMRSNLKIIL